MRTQDAGMPGQMISEYHFHNIVWPCSLANYP
jgi:hypothetical protein